MSVPEYKTWWENQKLKIKKAHGWLSPEDLQQAIGLRAEINGLQRAVQKEELMFSNAEAMKESVPERYKLLQEWKDRLDATQQEYDRLVGKKGRGAGEFKIPKATMDYWKKRGKTDEEIRRAFENKYGKNPPTIGF